MSLQYNDFDQLYMQWPNHKAKHASTDRAEALGGALGLQNLV